MFQLNSVFGRFLLVTCILLSVVFYGTWILQELYIYATGVNRLEIMVSGIPAFYFRVLEMIQIGFPNKISFAVIGAVVTVHLVCSLVPFAAVMWIKGGKR